MQKAPRLASWQNAHAYGINAAGVERFGHSSSAKKAKHVVEVLTLANQLYWKDKVKQEKRPFECCAEAHLLAEIVSSGKHSQGFWVYSFTDNGIDAAPCKNCKQWTLDAFHYVHMFSASYRPNSKQNPALPKAYDSDSDVDDAQSTAPYVDPAWWPPGSR